MTPARLSPRLTVLLIALAGPATAQDATCASAMDQSSLTQCAHDDWQAQDLKLNQVWPRALATAETIDAALPKAERGAVAQLKTAQRAWITYRDAACAAEGYPMHGGSAEPMLVYGCMARLTEARTRDLAILADLPF